MSWAVRVRTASGVTRRVYSDATSSITLQESSGPTTVVPELALIDQVEFHKERWGNEERSNTLWLSFLTGGESPIDVRSRDIVEFYTIETSAHVTAYGGVLNRYYPRARGIAVETPNRNRIRGDVEPVECVGSKEILRRVDMGNSRKLSSGPDLQTIAQDVLTNLSLPYDMGYVAAGTLGAVLTASIITGYPAGGVHEFMDFLVQQAKAGGVDTVWGVSNFGGIFIMVRPTDAGSIVTEGPALIDWEPVDSGDVVSRVRWAIGDGVAKQNINGAVDLSVPDPTSHVSDSGVTVHGVQTLTVRPPSTVPALTPISGTASVDVGYLEASYVGETKDGSATIGRITDGDPISYAVFRHQNPSQTGPSRRRLVLRYTFGANRSSGDIVAVSVRATLDERNDASFPYEMNALVQFWAANLGGGSASIATALDTVAEGEQIDALHLYGDRARNLDGASRLIEFVTLELGIPDGVLLSSQFATPVWAVEDFRVWTINEADLDAAAEDEYRFPIPSASRIAVPGDDPTITNNLTIIRSDQAVLTGVTARSLGLTWSSERGPETIVTIDSRATPESRREAAAIRDEARRANRQARLT